MPSGYRSRWRRCNVRFPIRPSFHRLRSASFRRSGPAYTSIEGYPYTSRRRSAPTPEGGGVSACDIRGAAVPGVEPVGHCARFFSRISPCAGPWGYRHGGEGLTGRGNSFPLPCLPHSNHLTSRRHPLPAPPAGRLPILLSAPPPRPRLRRSSPAPKRERWQCLRYQGSSHAREQRWKSFPERLGVASPYPAHPQDLPMHWIVVALCHWGRRPAGRGNASPLPCLSSPPPRPRLRPAGGSGPWHTRHGDGLPG